MATRSLDQPEKAKRVRLEKETTEHNDVTEFNERNPFTKGWDPLEEDEIELKFDDGESLYVSMWFLSAMSPIFERMFKSDFKERSDRCILMKGKEYEPFLDMLLHLHPRIKKDLSDDKITKIYEYAHEYQIGTVMTVAEDMLCDRVENTNFIGYPITIQNTIVLLLFAEKYSMTKLTSTAVKKLSIVPSRTLRSINIYNDLTWHSKFIIADMRLQRVDPNNYLTEEK